MAVKSAPKSKFKAGDSVIFTERLKIRLATQQVITIPAGTQAGKHSHAFEQFVIVESGRAKLTTASGDCVLEPGVVIRFPPDTWHQAVFETDTVLLEVNLRS